MQRFTVVLTPETDHSAYNVSVPALPGCFTWGSSVEEALERAREAIELYLESDESTDGQASTYTDSIIATVSV